MRTTWNGSISFGLVTIPVGLAPATKPAARQSDVSFRQLHRECGNPIKQKKWCPFHEREVDTDEIVRGWEIAKGQYVMIEDADLEAIEQVDTSRSIDIGRFVELAEAMRQAGVAALGRFVLAGKEKLCLIRPLGDALALETMFVHDDVKDHAEIDEAVGGADVKQPELDLAKQIIASLQGPFEPEQLKSEYRDRLRELLEAKAEGQEIVVPEPEEIAPVVDLMEALRASVAAAKTKPAASSTTKTAARKRAAVRK